MLTTRPPKPLMGWVDSGFDLDTREEEKCFASAWNRNLVPQFASYVTDCPCLSLCSQVEHCVIMLCCRYVPLGDDFIIVTISLSKSYAAPNTVCHLALRHSPWPLSCCQAFFSLWINVKNACHEDPVQTLAFHAEGLGFQIRRIKLAVCPHAFPSFSLWQRRCL